MLSRLYPSLYNNTFLILVHIVIAEPVVCLEEERPLASIRQSSNIRLKSTRVLIWLLYLRLIQVSYRKIKAWRRRCPRRTSRLSISAPTSLACLKNTSIFFATTRHLPTSSRRYRIRSKSCTSSKIWQGRSAFKQCQQMPHRSLPPIRWGLSIGISKAALRNFLPSLISCLLNGINRTSNFPRLNFLIIECNHCVFYTVDSKL